MKKQTASMMTRHGARLDADIYQPDDDGNYPVLLMRQPYGREIASTVVYAHPQWYANRGYIVVIQDVRGRGTSKGEFSLFSHEVTDGIDTVNWAAQLPGSNGLVGMYGFSYQGMTQLYAASGKPEALKTICPACIAPDLYADWAYEGGAFCFSANLGWAIQLATETARLNGDRIACQILYQASRNLPIYGLDSRLDEALRKYAPDSFYHEWLNHPEPGEYWQQLSPDLTDVDLPMLHIGGWFDSYLRGTLRWYREMAERSIYPQPLIIGPWGHLPWGRKLGEMDYGATASSPVDELQIAWFDRILKGKELKGKETEESDRAPVMLFQMGSNKWRSYAKWPDTNEKSYYLTSTGLANLNDEDGKLTETPATQDSEDIWIRDPWRPFPALGGHASSPTGACDRSLLECRTDTVTYTSEPLREPLAICGEAIVQLYLTASTPSFDISAILAEVKPDGRVYNIAQGYLRCNSSGTPVQISLQATFIELPPESCLRLSLSGDCFPAYNLNPGSQHNYVENDLIHAKTIAFSLRSGLSHPSKLLLSTIPSE
ncbi:CocE/NonD family hydrolase [Roseofilum casamattae]|uniref:CocE/NonD family hydrolase n=1 Tax=Roseofilum casamattae BLCC-M143 TaxID=3022442 RepID=A0ABT7BVZ6_9CYAN|nr:CocE/NonD family hydrolase [Roseofilum casamattae]MDJ1183372.1 CocE/NonD family hydrolase [Roseofilum casamattae BLCC-M143]